MHEAESLKQALADQLELEELDYGRVLELASKLSRLDPNKVRFSVDASHISRLGLELVAKQETAVSELVKNAFDADADTVDLIFRETSRPGGSIEILDNGHGMSREELIDGFMRISTQSKQSSPVSSRYRRQRAGRKGIGRFASQRLGNRLTVRTQVAGSDHSLQVAIDWGAFERGADLLLITNSIEAFPPVPMHGTTLLIGDLRDSWSEAQIRRAFRYVSELLQPFPLARKKPGEDEVDPGFRVAFYMDKDDDLVLLANEEQSILAHALATLRGEVDDDGNVTITLKSERANLVLDREVIDLEPKLRAKYEDSSPSYDLLKGVRFEAKYFIQDELPSGTRSTVREVLNKRGGIRVYRNGFRVLPYGESYDDWLGLQRSSALREVLPPHHNTNFLGFVEIVDVDGDRFEETASREGLVENLAFERLQDFVYRALMSGVIEIARARKRKVFASDKSAPGKRTRSASADEGPSPREQAADAVGLIKEFLGDYAGSSTSDDDGASTGEIDGGDATPSANDKAASMQAAIEEIEGLGRRAQELLEEVGMLRVLASLGLTIGEFTHEVRHALATLSAALLSKEGLVDMPTITENMALLQSYVRYFDDAVTQNAHRTLEVHEIRDLVAEFANVVNPTLQRQNVVVQTTFSGYDLFTRPMHRSEWASIFLNLFTNALKAIHRAKAKGRIFISAGRQDGFVYIDFSDNGDGIAAENKEHVFDAFFTTSRPSAALAADHEKLVGTGLGLKIVRDIVDAAGGEITVTSAPDGYTTCFRVEIPEAADEEIGNARY
ncbi:sensor histidine kinase [Rhodanobacter terrae]|uniref:histidine kinase n=1 Tax=Rhodanobacter terrae TaxID=418647 RepID=A0ABW0T0G6_9GAMM